MTLAITEDHRALAETAADFLTRRDARGAARALLEAPDEPMPAWWGELVMSATLGLSSERIVVRVGEPLRVGLRGR
jgi:hypothetical protein